MYLVVVAGLNMNPIQRLKKTVSCQPVLLTGTILVIAVWLTHYPINLSSLCPLPMLTLFSSFFQNTVGQGKHRQVWHTGGKILKVLSIAFVFEEIDFGFMLNACAVFHTEHDPQCFSFSFSIRWTQLVTLAVTDLHWRQQCGEVRVPLMTGRGSVVALYMKEHLCVHGRACLCTW